MIWFWFCSILFGQEQEYIFCKSAVYIWQLYDNLGVDNIEYELSGQKGSDKKQVLFKWSPLPYFVLKTFLLEIDQENGVKIHTPAATSPPWCDMNEMRGMIKDNPMCGENTWKHQGGIF